MAAKPTMITMEQTLLDVLDGSVTYFVLHEKDLTEGYLKPFVSTTGPIGLSSAYHPNGNLAAFAIIFTHRTAKTATARCLIIELYSRKRFASDLDDVPPMKRDAKIMEYLHLVLCRPAGHVFAFDLAPLVMSLYSELGLRVLSGVDIQSAFPDNEENRSPLAAVKAALDASPQIITPFERNIPGAFEAMMYKQGEHKDIINRAWITLFIAGLGGASEIFEAAPKVNTQRMTVQHLDVIGKLANDSRLLDQKKPTVQKHDVELSFDPETGVQVKSTRYQTRLRESRHGNQKTKMVIDGTKTGYTLAAQVGGVHGKSATVQTPDGTIEGKVVASVTSIGRDDPTMAESKRAATVLGMLQGTDELISKNPWIQNLWLTATNAWPPEWHVRTSSPQVVSDAELEHLNPSQRNAVKIMLSDEPEDHISLLHGPPGSGKTSTISAFVQAALRHGRGGIWLVAQSNVAVKNIAEKLAKDKFMDWRLLVSKDFQFQWNEHLYNESLMNNIIRSDTFKEAAKRLRGCKVVLCTVSMLSNPRVGMFMSVVPYRRLVVDEASQIEVGDYIPCLTAPFSSNLRSICFVGDDKQLPPFGQEEIKGLQSVFEISHLRERAVFLDTQYRMPPQIGEWVSNAVYDGRLQSNPLHPVTNTVLATRFIDSGGSEIPQGTSYKNLAECETILALSKQLQDEGRRYRIITPYDAQRTMIEKALQDAELDWADKCFNVDSFQGNEEDFIVISLVRTRGLGFLKDLRRTNVMLTRCKRGMFVVSNKEFLSNGAGSESLVGDLAAKSEKDRGPTVWANYKDIVEGRFQVAETNNKRD